MVMTSLNRYITRRQWTRAWAELIRLLDTGVLDVTDYDAWGRYAGKIEVGIGKNWRRREIFWRDLNRVVAGAEIKAGSRTHKGFIYFKIGAMSLFSGRTFKTAVLWFKRAYEEDKRLYPIPKHQSAYRLLVVVRAFERFCQGIRDVNTRKALARIVKARRAEIGRFIGAVYDRTIADPPMLRTLGWAAFDRLLGRNPFRALVEQNYRGAQWLCEHKEEINRTNLHKYGLAQSAVVLCGTTVEGILLSMSAVRRRVRLIFKRTKYSLDLLTVAYLQGLRGMPELAAGLVFVWFARNLIHPDFAKKLKGFVVDMNFADFAWTLTGGVVARMARRSRRRQTA